MDDSTFDRTKLFGGSGAPAAAPGLSAATAPSGVSSTPGGPAAAPGPVGATAGPAQAGPAGTTVQAPPPASPPAPALPPAPPGSLAQGLTPRFLGPPVQAPPSSGAPGSLAQGMPPVPKWDPSTVATEAPAFAKNVSDWAKGHTAMAALRSKGWGDHFSVPPSAPGAVQAAQSAAPGTASFSPTVQSMLGRLRAQGWNHAQVPGSATSSATRMESRPSSIRRTGA
jgi:hypothetical protein